MLPGRTKDGSVCGTDRLRELIGRQRQVGIVLWGVGCGLVARRFYAGQNGLDCHAACHFTCVASSHAVTDDVEPERGIRDEAILVMGTFPPDI